VLTLFAMPKPFKGLIGTIQKNAIRSWIKACSECEIILFGTDDGTEETASDLGLRYISDVVNNEHGTPLVSSLFEQAQQYATHDLLAYVNADIILTSDFPQAIEELTSKVERFLMVGQRWDVAIEKPWNFDIPEWEENIRSYTEEYGKLHPKTGIDYFVFSRGLYDVIPPFAIGRTAWDNWLIYYARKKSALVVDATARVMAIHQNHDYGSVSKTQLWRGEEARRNQRLMGGGYGTLDDASHYLLEEGISYAWSFQQIFRHPRRLVGRYRILRIPVRVMDTILELSRPIRSALRLSNILRRTKQS